MQGERADFPHSEYCPHFQRITELIGRRWTASILRALFAGKERFAEIARTIPGLSHRLLSERLRELIESGLVVVVEEGAHDLYNLSERGADLREVLNQMEMWNVRWYELDQNIRVGD